MGRAKRGSELGQGGGCSLLSGGAELLSTLSEQGFLLCEELCFAQPRLFELGDLLLAVLIPRCQTSYTQTSIVGDTPSVAVYDPSVRSPLLS